MKKIVLLFILSACSITFKDEFLTNIQGTYTSGKQPNEQTFVVHKNGRFIHNNIIYTYKEALTPTNAIYQLDDVTYAGIIFDATKSELKKILSTNTSSSGIVWTNHSSLLGKKETPKIETK